MSAGAIPLVAVGTLTGNLPTGARARTMGAPPLAPGQSFNPVDLDESKAVTDLKLNPYPTLKVSADNPDTALMQQLLSMQEKSQS